VPETVLFVSWPQVTAIFRPWVKAGCEEAFERWVFRVSAFAKENYEGHIGTDILHPAEGSQRWGSFWFNCSAFTKRDVSWMLRLCRYVLIMKFDTLDHLNAWMNSDDRRKLLAEGQKLVAVDNEPPSEIRQGSIVPIESQVSVKGGESAPSGPPAMWKVLLLVLIAVCKLARLVFDCPVTRS
jgi:antibiotic biosynthesis monooxygenase (ABM) superfamily enzyme